MRWTLLSLWLLGGALFVVSALTPSPDTSQNECRQSTALDRSGDAQAVSAALTGGQAAAPAVSRDEESLPEAEIEKPATDLFTSSISETGPAPGNDPDQFLSAQLLRGTPVHNGPAVESDVLGYAATGSTMQLVERKDGWARVIDPATSRQGWIYDEHLAITRGPFVRPEKTTDERAALEDEGDLGETDRPKRSFKNSNAGRSYAKKRWRKSWRFVRRFRRF